MNSMEPKKLALMRIMQIFEEKSDYDHPLTQEDISNHLENDYGIVIENSKNCIIRNNTMMDGARKELVVAKNNMDCLIDDNLGSLADANWQSGSELLN